MSSILDSEKCSQCGGEYLVNYHYNTQEEYGFCDRCGKSHFRKIKRDTNHNICRDADGCIIYVEDSKEGYGICRICYIDAGGYTSSLKEPLNDKQINSFREAMLLPEVDEEKSCLTSWDCKNKKIVAVYGKVPPSFDEICEENNKKY